MASNRSSIVHPYDFYEVLERFNFLNVEQLCRSIVGGEHPFAVQPVSTRPPFAALAICLKPARPAGDKIELFLTKYGSCKTLSSGGPPLGRSPIELMQHMVAGTMNGHPAGPPHPGAMMMPMNGRPQSYRTPPMGAPMPGMAMPPSQMPQSLGMSDPLGMRQAMPPPVAPSPASLPASGPPNPIGPSPTPLEFRIHDINRRLYTFNNSGINEQDHKQWFEAFSHEFFDDEAVIYLVFPPDDNYPAEKCVIHRGLIPRFFLTFVEAKAKEVYFVLRGPTREHQNDRSGLIHFENDNVLFVQRLERQEFPYNCQLEAECKLAIEFTPYDEMLNHRIREWRMEIRNFRELCYNGITKELQQADLRGGVGLSRAGICHQSHHFMHMARILEPMQVLMAHSKAHHVTEPKELLRRTLFNHQSKINDYTSRMATPMMPPTPVEETKPKPTRKRTRKPAANAKNKKTNASPAPANPAFPTNQMPGSFNTMGYQDVMVVGEPSMMGGDYGEEDERTISRVENTQYDPNALQFKMQQAAMSSLGAGMLPPGSLPPGAHMPHPNGVPPHGGIPAGIAHPHPQMGGMGPPPGQNAMPPPYGYGQPQGSWPSQPNTTMITG